MRKISSKAFRLLLKIFFIFPSVFVNAQYYQNFDNVSTMYSSGGWNQVNKSNPVGTCLWSQDNYVFTAHSGAANSSIMANYMSVNTFGTISNWLFAPFMNIKNGDKIAFYTISQYSNKPDRLQVRMNTNGNSTNVGATESTVGDFTTLLLEINASQTAGGYPLTWTKQTITVSGVTGTVSGRIAFRYYVTSAGFSGSNASTIAIDDFCFNYNLGIKEYEYNSKINIYPSPVNDYFELTSDYLKGKKIEIKIYNISGKIVEQKTIENFCKTKFETIAYSKGVYFVEVTAPDFIFTKKIIVK
ncbi:MAG: choice-of-anchor J domain-containing protein [Bacteroidales bacterium]|nr:choice-of-anchor J domain-containing protein [Bacteroidales bacterium]